MRVPSLQQRNVCKVGFHNIGAAQEGHPIRRIVNIVSPKLGAVIDSAVMPGCKPIEWRRRDRKPLQELPGLVGSRKIRARGKPETLLG
jgi:hypothetical protein